jgi:hypothetical protein
MGTLNRHYARLLDPDIALLLDFQSEHLGAYISWTYDQRVGPGRDPGPETDPHIRKMALDLSRRRIDCIAEANDRIDLIEICQEATYRTVGQLPVYTDHFRSDFAPTKPVRQCILCRSIAADLAQFCRLSDYQVWIYPAETAETP